MLTREQCIQEIGQVMQAVSQGHMSLAVGKQLAAGAIDIYALSLSSKVFQETVNSVETSFGIVHIGY